MKLNTKGFAVLEILLIFVILGILGGTGYYVYHSNKKASNDYSATPSAASAKENGGKGGGGPHTGPSKSEVFLIPEWHVAATIPTPSEDSALIQYQIVKQDGQEWAEFSTQNLKDAGQDCSAGIISRALGTDHSYLNDGTDTGKTIQQEINNGVLKPYQKVGDYYYWYQNPQTKCSDNPKIEAMAKIAEKNVKLIAQKLTAAE